MQGDGISDICKYRPVRNSHPVTFSDHMSCYGVLHQPQILVCLCIYFLIMFISLFVSSLSSPPSSVLLSLHQRAFPLHRSNCYLGCGKLRVKHLIFHKQLGVRHQWHVYKDSPGRPHLTLCFRKVWLLKSSSAERQGMVTCALCPVKTAHECLACSDYE